MTLLFRYCMNMGLLRGSGIFFRNEFLKNNKIILGRNDKPVLFRPGTHDLHVFREIFLYRCYDIPVNNDIKTIIDAGAHIGLATIFFRKKYKNATIFSIEPDPGNFELLKKNTGDHAGIIPVHGAVWNRDANLKIKDPGENTWSFEVIPGPGGETNAIRGISITSIMKEEKISIIDLLKLDVEGAEKEIFEDNFDFWINHTRNIILELHDWRKKECSRTVFRAISQYHFNVTVMNGLLWFKNLNLT